jgi:hypothetical protein
MAIMSVAAVACAIWIKLPLPVRLAIGGLAASVFVWSIKLALELIPDDIAVLDWIVRGGNRQKHVIKRRDKNEE